MPLSVVTSSAGAPDSPAAAAAAAASRRRSAAAASAAAGVGLAAFVAVDGQAERLAALLGSACSRCSGISVIVVSLPTYSGPEMPPSLRTRQKWTAMKMTMTNGNSSTCSTYQRSSVSLPISLDPSSTYLTWVPKTGV